jgi:hypothetical protein
MLSKLLCRAGAYLSLCLIKYGNVYEKRVRPWLLRHEHEIVLFLLVISLVRGCGSLQLHEMQHALSRTDNQPPA